MLRSAWLKGFCAGLCISIGGCVFLSCENRYVGAFLFCAALLTICMFGFSLYTGKVGYIVESHRGADIADLFFGLIGNLAGCVLFGLAAGVGIPALIEKSRTICDAKLSQSFPEALIRAFFCGVLMYAAVWIFKSKNSPLGILIFVPVFILSGFEHSIADTFYFSVSGYFTPSVLLYIIIIIAGNSLGGVFIPIAEKLARLKINEQKS